MKRDPICEVEQELKTFHSQLSLPIIIAADRRKFAGGGGGITRLLQENFIIGALSEENWTGSKRNEGEVFVSKASGPSIFEFAVFSRSSLKGKIDEKIPDTRTRTTPRYSWRGNAIKGTRRYPDPAGNYECLSRYIIRYFRNARSNQSSFDQENRSDPSNSCNSRNFHDLTLLFFSFCFKSRRTYSYKFVDFVYRLQE